MDLRRGSKRIKSIYKGENYIPGLMVNDRLWQGSPGSVQLVYVNSDSPANFHKVYYGLHVYKSDEIIVVSSGGIAVDAEIQHYASMYVHGGTANAARVTHRASLTVMSGVINDTYMSDAQVTIMDAGIANHTKFVDFFSYMYIESGGKAYDLDITRGGVYVSGSSALARDIVLGIAGSAFVASDGVVSNVVITSRGSMYLSGGTVYAENITVSSGGYFYIYSGGTAHNVTSHYGADITVDGGTITYTNE